MRPGVRIRAARPMTGRPGPPRKPGLPTKPGSPPSAPPRWRWLLPAGFVLAFMALLLFRPGAGGTPAQPLSYTSFVGDVTAGKVSTAAITAAGAVSGKLHDGSAYTSQIPTALNDSALPALLLGHKVQVTGTVPSTNSVLGFIVVWALPLLIFAGL